MHARKTLIAAVVALAAATASPAVAGAQPNTGSGGSDSSYCQTLRERIQRYNDLAHDMSLPQSVRAFYATRAQITLIHAREANCGWAAIQAGGGTAGEATPAGPATRAAGTAPSNTARTTRRRAAFRTLNRRLRVRASRTTTGMPSGGNVPSGVAFIKANPTGNPSQDDYCRKAADLIADAERQGDQATADNHPQDADAWYELADYMIDVATQNGCRFVFGIKASGLSEYRAASVVATRG
jgi:hypothetical protein